VSPKPLTAVVLVALLLAASPAWSPVSLGYVTSDSMAPTLAAGDGFLLLPGPVAVGDIVTYRDARTGALVTHRVVGRTGDDYLTRGDANRATDQAVGTPVVTDANLVGRVATLGGRPATLPGLGSAAATVRANPLPLLGAAALAVAAWTLFAARGTARPARSVRRSGEVVWPLLLVAALATTALVAAGGSEHVVTTVVTTEGVSATLPVGGTAVQQLSVVVAGSPLATSLVATEGGRVVGTDGTLTGTDLVPFVTGRDPVAVALPGVGSVPTGVRRTYALPVAVETPPEPGVVETRVTVRSYPATLPESVLRSLHDRHPLLAAAGATLAGFAPLALGYWLLFDPRRPLRPDRDRPSRRPNTRVGR
jgi:signal peptidase